MEEVPAGDIKTVALKRVHDNGLPFGDEFIRIHQCASHGGPGCARDDGFRSEVAGEGLGRCRCGGETLFLLLIEVQHGGKFLGSRRTRETAYERVGDPLLGSARGFCQMFAKSLHGFDDGNVVEQRQSLERCV